MVRAFDQVGVMSGMLRCEQRGEEAREGGVNFILWL